MILRTPRQNELEQLSDLCLRSKAVWGYDTEFLETCREELTLQSHDLKTTDIAVAQQDDELVGVVQLDRPDDAGDAELMLMFVDPDYLGQGIGRRLMEWAVERARSTGTRRIRIESDPEALPFYTRMGATQIGTVPSCSIPGRSLPLLTLEL